MKDEIEEDMELAKMMYDIVHPSIFCPCDECHDKRIKENIAALSKYR